MNHFTCGLGVGWGAVDGEGWGSGEHFLANLATILIGLDLLVDNNLKKTLDHFSYRLGGRWMGRDGECFFSILSSILIGLDWLDWTTLPVDGGLGAGRGSVDGSGWGGVKGDCQGRL